MENRLKKQPNFYKIHFPLDHKYLANISGFERGFSKIFLFITYCVIFTAVIFAADTTKTPDISGRKELNNPVDYQLQIDKIEKDIKDIKEKINQSLIEGCNRNIQTVNSLITWVGIVATVFGVIIAIGGIFIALESNRSRLRREEAIKTLENAKLFIIKKKTEFNEIMKEKLNEIDKFFNLTLEELSQDAEEATRKIKEKEEKGMTTEAEKKVELLEKRIRFFEEIGLPDDPKLLYSKAMVCKEKGMLEESIKLLEKAVKVDPNYKEAYWQIGWINLKLKNYEKSVDAYTKVIKLDPNDSSAYNNKGVSLNRLGKKEEALECYKKAIELNPKEVLYYTNKAEILDDLKRYEEAEEVLKEAIKLDFKDTQLYRNNAKILLKLGNINDALSSLDRAIEIKPNDISNYHEKGRILTKVGNLKDALKCYEKTSNILKDKIRKPDVKEVDLLNYFENYLILGNYKEATELKSKIENKIKSNEYIYIFHFLSSCLFLLNGKENSGLNLIVQIADDFAKKPLEKPTAWNFEDIDPFLKSRLSNDLYEICIAAEKMLLKEISPDECRIKLEKLKGNHKR